MTIRSQYLFWVATLLAAGTGCPSINDPAGIHSGSEASLESVRELGDDPAVLMSRAAPACVQIGQPATSVHEAMLSELNLYRVENSLSPLIYSKTLEAAANAQAKNLYVRDFFDHIDPDGKDPGDRALDANFCHRYVGENIAAGQASAHAAMVAWKNSPSHNENMLKPEYVYTGMGHYTDPNGRQYWAQSFAYDVPETLANR